MLQCAHSWCTPTSFKFLKLDHEIDVSHVLNFHLHHISNMFMCFSLIDVLNVFELHQLNRFLWVFPCAEYIYTWCFNCSKYPNFIISTLFMFFSLIGILKVSALHQLSGFSMGFSKCSVYFYVKTCNVFVIRFSVFVNCYIILQWYTQY